MRIVFKRMKSFWVRYQHNKLGVLGLSIILFLCLIALFAHYLAPYDPYTMKFNEVLVGPSAAHIMGTDNFGRDIMSRVIWGTRVSLLTGFVSTFISAVFGITIGVTAGYLGGKVDAITMRIVDMLLVFPAFFLALLTAAIFGGNLWITIGIIGLTIWPSTARLVRSEVLSIKERDFVIAVKSIGASDFHIIFREVLPNALYPAVVNTSLLFGYAILIEASLSFIGAGDPNLVSWGWMMNESIQFFRRAWWMPFFPGLFISLAVVSFNLVGDSLNEITRK